MALFNLIEKKRKEKRKKIVKAATVSTLVGGTIGVVSGVLLAPKSGKETRNDIKERVTDVKAKTVEQSKALKNNMKEAKEKIKNYLNNKKEKENASEQEIEIQEIVLSEETAENNI